MNMLWRSPLSHRLMIGAGLSVFAFAAAGATEGQTSDDQATRRPMPIPSVASNNCPQEAANYAAAVTALELAQDAANDAFGVWYDCEMQYGGGYKPTDNGHLVTETSSILDQE